jgi:hypothetical protein
MKTWHSDKELSLLEWAVKEGLKVPGVLVEIGVGSGRTADLILAHSDGRTTYLIDNYSLPDGPRPDPALFSRPEFIFLKMHSCEALRHIQAPRIAFAHVDGDHSYDGAYNDIRGLSWTLREGSIVALHDFHSRTYPDVAAAWWGAGPRAEDVGRVDSLQVFKILP